MRILISSVPAVAHVLATTPLARALRRRGHEVALLSGAEVAPWLPADVGRRVAGPELATMLAESRRRHPDQDERLRHGIDASIGRFFGGLRVECTIDDARAGAAEFSPDLVIAEGLDGVGPVLAAERGVPLATISLGPVCSAEIDAGITEQLDAEGFPTVAPGLRLDPWPVALRPPGWAPPGPASVWHPMRAELGLDPAAPGTPVALPAGEGPCVLLTLGTLFARVDGLQALLDGLVAAGLRVVCALAPSIDPGQLHVADPTRAVVAPFGPLDGVLDAVDAVVCHGGATTLLAALVRGRPPVVMPLAADHFMNAEGVRAAGVGRVVGGIDPGAVATAAGEVVAEPVVGAAARDLAATIAAAPSPDDVVDRLEALVT